jgi:tRNA (guanosine-2'-O-)-methyltransferase
VSRATRSRPRDIRTQRRPTAHSCWGHLIVAPLWVAYGANLGTLLRTCDAVGACMAVPDTPHYREALAKGDTLARRPHVHRVRGTKEGWLRREAERSTIVAVELAEGAVALPRLDPARGRTVVLLGHEHRGVPDEAMELADLAVEIPMVGMGASLNVAVAGSLVLYRLAGLV